MYLLTKSEILASGVTMHFSGVTDAGNIIGSKAEVAEMRGILWSIYPKDKRTKA